MFRYPFGDEEVCQSFYDLMRGDLSFHRDIQAFPGVLIKDIQHPEGPSVMSP